MSAQIEVKGPYQTEQDTSEQVYDIFLGRKKLKLGIYPWGQATCRIDNMDGRDKVSGETTLIFTEAKRILEREASRNGISIHFYMDTGFPRLVNWAKTTGAILFHWTIEPTIDDPLRIHASTDINPK